MKIWKEISATDWDGPQSVSGYLWKYYTSVDKEKWLEINEKLRIAANLERGSWFDFDKWQRAVFKEEFIEAFRAADL